MAVIDFPNITPDSELWMLEYKSQTFESDLNGALQTAELPGARWSASITFTNRQGMDVRKLQGFLTKLKGKVGRFWLTPSDWEPYGTALGSPEVAANAAAGVNTISTTGWTPSQSEALAAGDYFEVNGELKKITDTVTADGSGNASVEFAPPLRIAVTTGMQLRITEPRCLMALDGDDQASWSTTSPIIYAITFDAMEPLDI